MRQRSGSKAARARPRKTNVDILVENRCVNPKKLKPKHRAAINRLSRAEVRALIRVRRVVGHFPRPRSNVWFL